MSDFLSAVLCSPRVVVVGFQLQSGELLDRSQKQLCMSTRAPLTHGGRRRVLSAFAATATAPVQSASALPAHFADLDRLQESYPHLPCFQPPSVPAASSVRRSSSSPDSSSGGGNTAGAVVVPCMCVDLVTLARALRPDLLRTPQISLTRLVNMVRRRITCVHGQRWSCGGLPLACLLSVCGFAFPVMSALKQRFGGREVHPLAEVEECRSSLFVWSFWRAIVIPALTACAGAGQAAGQGAAAE